MSAAPGLASVAAAAHVSPAHLRRMFWRVRGESPRTAIDRLRYQRACELLADPETRLADVAAACGFSEASALSRGFASHTGFSPLAWRQQRLQALVREQRTARVDPSASASAARRNGG